MFYRCPRYPRFIDLALRKSKPKKFSRFPRFPGFSRSRSSNCSGKKKFRSWIFWTKLHFMYEYLLIKNISHNNFTRINLSSRVNSLWQSVFTKHLLTKIFLTKFFNAGTYRSGDWLRFLLIGLYPIDERIDGEKWYQTKVTAGSNINWQDWIKVITAHPRTKNLN